MPNPWPDYQSIPRPAAAILSAFRFDDPSTDCLEQLDDRGWREALDFCDRSQITLLLRERAGALLPEWVRQRTEGDVAKNQVRLADIEKLYVSIARQLGEAGIEFLALKGITQAPLFGIALENRVQYDIDLYVPRERVRKACDVILPLGFEPMEGMDDFPTDHLPALIRKTGWQWRGDFFDTAIPVAVELHFQFWDESTEALPAPGVEQFWERRQHRAVAGVDTGVLAPHDAFGYSALHLARHLLRGNVRPFHVYELGRFLERHGGDGDFWSEWETLHAPGLRRLQSVACLLAERWFGCELPRAVREEASRLPEGAQRWFREFALSPAVQPFRINKDELWLHLSLLDSAGARWRVARRRLFPMQMPGPVDAIYVPDREMTWRRRLRKRLLYAAHLVARFGYHAAALPQVAASGMRWRWEAAGLGRPFWQFVASAVLLNFALFIFILLYNLRLLDLGFREDFIGVVNAASTAGTVAGTLPAAWLARRLGLRRTLLTTFAASAVIVALRSVVAARVPLVALSAVWGLAFSLWVVVFTPVIAAAVRKEQRATAFSVYFAAMFSVGVAADWVGGRLPQWLHGKQPALLFSALLVTAAYLPAWQMKLVETGLPSESKTYPRGAFMRRYLVAFAAWSLAVASLNPFANAYFARRNLPVAQIGSIFSAAQFTQIGAVLLAPAILARVGTVQGIGAMMVATGLALGALASQPAATAAAAASYVAYMSFQWMSEPGLTTLLMDRVKERERGGAAALNYLVSFSAQAVASAGAGFLLARHGYGAVLAGAALLAGAAAVLLRRVRSAD